MSSSQKNGSSIKSSNDPYNNSYGLQEPNRMGGVSSIAGNQIVMGGAQSNKNQIPLNNDLPMHQTESQSKQKDDLKQLDNLLFDLL